MTISMKLTLMITNRVFGSEESETYQLSATTKKIAVAHWYD